MIKITQVLYLLSLGDAPVKPAHSAGQENLQPPIPALASACASEKEMG